MLGLFFLSHRNSGFFFQSALGSDVLFLSFTLKAPFVLLSDPLESDLLFDLDLPLARLFSLDKAFLAENLILFLADAFFLQL